MCLLHCPKEKENQYKIRKIKEKKNKNCLFQHLITLNQIYNPIYMQEKGKPTSFQLIYSLAITIYLPPT